MVGAQLLTPVVGWVPGYKLGYPWIIPLNTWRLIQEEGKGKKMVSFMCTVQFTVWKQYRARGWFRVRTPSWVGYSQECGLVPVFNMPYVCHLQRFWQQSRWPSGKINVKKTVVFIIMCKARSKLTHMKQQRIVFIASTAVDIKLSPHVTKIQYQYDCACHLV